MTNENLSVYDRICRTRKSGRATASDYINATITDFVELHGDRCFADDHAIVGGIGRLKGKPVTVIGIEKGRDLNERLLRNFGCVLPEGYRKALRLIKQAEKFHRPVICFVDTQGANCGKGAEERGQGQAIANNLYELTDVKTPIISHSRRKTLPPSNLAMTARWRMCSRASSPATTTAGRMPTRSH